MMNPKVLMRWFRGKARSSVLRFSYTTSGLFISRAVKWISNSSPSPNCALKNSRIGPNSTGAKIFSGALRPSRPMVDNSPKMPKMWSPWMWLRQICSIFRKEMPAFRICIWAPSPQSIMNNRPRTSTICALGYLVDVGNADAVPNM